MSEPLCIHTGDSAAPREGFTLPVVIVLDRLRSAYNTGNIFRIAEAVRASRIIACGYTPCPPHDKLARTARGCDGIVDCSHAESAAAAVSALRRDGYTVYAVDTITNAALYSECRLRFPCAMLFGNEALGISEEALALCDSAICLPACGFKNSINVGNCAAVALFEALRQFKGQMKHE